MHGLRDEQGRTEPGLRSGVRSVCVLPEGQRDGLSPELTESGTGGRFGSREEREHRRGEERAGLFFQLHGRRETPGTKEGRKERPGQTGRDRDGKTRATQVVAKHQAGQV